MATIQNFSRVFKNIAPNNFGNVCARNKTDLAKVQLFKGSINLAYASYQGTESIFVKGKTRELPTPLIIVHGLLGSKSNFNKFSKRYHDHTDPKRLVYAVDLRNHGDSAHAKDNSYDDLVMDIFKFIEGMDLRKVSLMGHDMGGRASMLFSLKYPAFVDKLIVIDISPITTSHKFKNVPEVLKTLELMTFPQKLTLAQARIHAATILSRYIKEKGHMMFVLMNLVQTTDGRYKWRCNIRALLENFTYISSFPEIHNLTFSGPTLFVGGSQSDFIQKSDYPKIRHLFPNAELKYIDGAGHWVHSEKPTEFLKITMEFLNKPREEKTL